MNVEQWWNDDKLGKIEEGRREVCSNATCLTIDLTYSHPGLNINFDGKSDSLTG
jgi:hypothetical protein